MKIYKLLIATLLLSYIANAQLYIDTPDYVQPALTARAERVYHLNVLSNKLIFTAIDSNNTTGAEWWWYDAANNTAAMGPEAYPGPNDGWEYPSIPTGKDAFSCIVSNKIYYPGVNAAVGLEPFMWDGTNAPQVAVDINAGATGSFPKGFTACAGKVFFYLDTTSFYKNIYEYDPATQKLSYVATVNELAAAMTSHNNKLFYCSAASRHIYEYNPVTQTTITHNNVFLSGPTLRNFTSYGSNIFFTSGPWGSSNHIGLFDGTKAVSLNTAADVYDQHPKNTELYNIYPYGGKVYYWKETAGKFSLAYYDTLTKNLSATANFQPLSLNGSSKYLSFLLIHNNDIFFNADGHLIRFDGTKSDTMLPMICHPANMKVYNNDIYLAAMVGKNVTQLFRFKDTLVP